MFNNRFLVFLPVILLLSILSCGDTEKKMNSDLELVRFDQLLMELDSQNIRTAFDNLEKQYPEFCTLYFQEVLPIPGYVTKNDTFFQNLLGFISEEKIIHLYNLVQEQYPDFENELNEIDGAIEKAKKWFPDVKDPRVYTFISEFGYQRFIFEDADGDGLAIGLDLFLNDAFDYSILESGTNTFSQYLTRTYNKEHLVKKTIDAWLEDKLGMVQGDRLIDQMIFNGTKLYLLEDILESPDSIITEYPQEKLEWLENNEKELWSYYFQNNWFYTTDQYIIKRLVFPAPNSTALRMPSGAPGQTGNYLGWKIVKSYMKRFPETAVQDLLTTDAQKILETSRYKPENK